VSEISRRDFIQKSSAAAAGAALPTARMTKLSNNNNPVIKRFKPFGNTGWKVSDISAGGGGDPGVMQYQYESGINFFDTAYGYGSHEEVLGGVLRKWQRDKVFITTKWDFQMDLENATKKQLLDAIDVSLRRLQTPYIDCMMIHAIGQPGLGDFNKVKNPAIREAWEEAKKQGKIRFTGASGCGVNLLEEMNWAIDNDLFDVILVGANFLTHGLEGLVKKAKDKGVAVIAMKVMTVIRYGLNIRSLMNKNTNVRQAVVKYMLSKDLFDTLLLTMRNFDQAREYISLSGLTTLSAEEEELLNQLAAEISTYYCRPGCSDCYGTCPHNVLISDILRYKLYFEHYGEEKRAIQYYRRIPESQTPVQCISCSAPCQEACSYKIPIRERLIEAREQFTLA